jgi:hypothetical protein
LEDEEKNLLDRLGKLEKTNASAQIKFDAAKRDTEVAERELTDIENRMQDAVHKRGPFMDNMARVEDELDWARQVGGYFFMECNSCCQAKCLHYHTKWGLFGSSWLGFVII